MSLTTFSSSFTLASELVAVKCYLCGVVFGLESGLREKRLEDHREFYCTNGHVQSYIGKTEAQRLREQLTKTEACLQYARQDTERIKGHLATTTNRLRGTKAVVTRMKRRTVKGQCVCCSKKFKDLELHMKNRHPGFDPEKAAEMLAGKP